MKAFLKNYRQSPRKVRLVGDLIKSKRVAEALTILDNLPKRASSPIQTLLNSALSNAKQRGVKEDNLFIENVTVNKGIVLKRIMPRARGSASRINKRTSHVMLTLVEKTVEKKAKKAVKETSKKSKVTKKVENKA
ncbi:MAG TPA: 50S ribosomal protein L22 [Candidatus Paceibacterota bacterium]|nr:50S ribosomal protein L22 [Candidatus Paceibacterota bacterium]